VGDGGNNQAGGPGRQGRVHAHAPWQRMLKEFTRSEKTESDRPLTAAFKERTEGEEASTDGRGEAETEAPSSHIAMLGTAGRRWWAFHIWHSSLRSPP